MEKKSLSKSIIISGSIVIGLFILGIFIYKGLKTFSDKDRVVTVKGLAEMNMTAASSTIDISFSISGDDLQGILKQAESKKSAIVTYITSSGYSKNDIKIENIKVNDRQKYYDYEWVEGKRVQVKIDRYSVNQRLSIKSDDVKETENKASKIELALINKDLIADVSSNYIFPELNSIKPLLIAESTKNARIAGEQFANDSQAKLGKIKTASQGQITIAGQYYYEENGDGSNEKPKEPYLQKARVVSTIVFFLE